MQHDLYENPLGTDGFEFVEFTSPDPQALSGSLNCPQLRRDYFECWQGLRSHFDPTRP